MVHHTVRSNELIVRFYTLMDLGWLFFFINMNKVIKKHALKKFKFLMKIFAGTLNYLVYIDSINSAGLRHLSLWHVLHGSFQFNSKKFSMLCNLASRILIKLGVQIIPTYFV